MKQTTIRSWAVAAMCVCVAGSAQANRGDSFTGNIVYGNGSGNWSIAAGSYGDAEFGANNATGDAMLQDAYDETTPDGVFNYSPAAGSIADGTNALSPVAEHLYRGTTYDKCTDDASADRELGYITEQCYVGALRPGIAPGDPAYWLDGWTTTNITGDAGPTGRNAIVIFGRVGVVDDPAIDPDDNTLTWTADNDYFLRGRCSVGDFDAAATQAACDVDGDVLNIEADVWVYGEEATAGWLVVNRGSELNVMGEADGPVVFTSDQAPGEKTRGGWGGVVIHGCAIANCVDCLGGDSCASEGGDAGFFCGQDDSDSSGSIRYARVEFAGIDVATDDELNAWTMNGVGSGTTLEYMQALMGLDDQFEWFGGKAYGKYWYSLGGDDDGFDWQMGFRGGLQYAIDVHFEDAGDKGIEADNNENDFDAPCRANPIMANLTLIGPRLITGFELPTDGFNPRRGTDYSFHNSIVTGWPAWGADVDDAATTAAPFIATAGADCQFVGVADATVPAVAFKAYPNPVTTLATFAFELGTAGPVDISVYDVSGRMVENVARGQFDAGNHNVNWNVPAEMAAGVYYYRLQVAGQELGGKFFRVQ